MKNFTTIILTFFITIACMGSLNAQCDDMEIIPIPNPSFDDWADEGNYYDPTPASMEDGSGFWDTTNKIANLNPFFNSTVTRVEDSHSGTYGVKLETSSNFGFLTSASLFSGFFNPTLQNPLSSAEFGKPFTETPNYFRVWYKYEPVQGDSAEIYCYLGKGVDESTRIASAYAKIKEAKSEWTELLIPFDYVSGETPDTIMIVFASSADGDNFEGQVGNTLYVDDVELIKCSYPVPNEDLIAEAFTANVFPNPSFGENLRFEFNQERDVTLNIFSVDGKSVFTTDFNSDNYELDIAEWNNGFYQYVINDKDSNEAISRGSFVIQ